MRRGSKNVLDIMVFEKAGWALLPIFVGYGYDGEVMHVMVDGCLGPF